MGNFINKLLMLAIVAGISHSAFAQQDYVHQVIIANEGWFNYDSLRQEVSATMAAYDPATGNYTVFDTIEGAEFTSDVVVTESHIFVAADSFLIKYDKNSLQRVDVQVVQGIRKLAAWNDKILLTRGDYDNATFSPIPFESYFQVYDQSDLSLVYALDTLNGPAYAAEGIQVKDGKAYVAINDGFDFSSPIGLIGFVDLTNESYDSELDLGVNGINPENVMLNDGNLYTLNNFKDFTGSSVSAFSLTDPNNTLQTTKLPNISSGCGTSTFYADMVIYQEYGAVKVYAFDPSGNVVADTFALGKNFYGLGVDPVNNHLYATTTDFTSTGMLYIYNDAGGVLDSVGVGVSAGNLAFDVRKTTSLGENGLANVDVTVFPNPAQHNVTVTLKGFQAAQVDYQLTNVLGQVFTSGELQTASGNITRQLSLDGLASGIYYLNLTTAEGQLTRKIVKQ